MHNKTNPYLASIKERYLLSGEGSKRRTYHLVLDLKGSGLKYTAGDSLGIFPTNDPIIVDRTIKAMKASGNEWVKGKNDEHEIQLKEFLTNKANLSQFSRKLISEITARQTNNTKKELLLSLLNNAHHNTLKAYQEQHHVWDLLDAHPEVSFDPKELSLMLMPLLPRLYSIASAQDVVDEEVHLTIAFLAYQSNQHQREGTTTSFLCRRTSMNQPIVPVYVQPNHGFTLPQNPNTPIIMIGPGTGIAPFRAFMQQRKHDKAQGQNWLFFGEWNRQYDFFYEGFWHTIPQLKVTTAFSRDQPEKIYVQHRMIEHGREIYEWIQNGAYVFVCGSAHHMAKDVDAALHKIIETHGNVDTGEARNVVKQLRSDKRYLRDVY